MRDINMAYHSDWAMPRVRPNTAQSFVFLFMALLLVVHIGLYGALVSGMMPPAGAEPLCTTWDLLGP